MSVIRRSESRSRKAIAITRAGSRFEGNHILELEDEPKTKTTIKQMVTWWRPN